VFDLRDRKEQDLENKRKFFLDALKEEQSQFETEIKSLAENVDKLSKYQEIDK